MTLGLRQGTGPNSRIEGGSEPQKKGTTKFAGNAMSLHSTAVSLGIGRGGILIQGVEKHLVTDPGSAKPVVMRVVGVAVNALFKAISSPLCLMLVLR